MRRLKSRLARLTLACAVAGVCAASAAPSAGAVSRDFFGVVAIQPPTASTFQTMGRGRVGTVRALLFWASVEPNPVARDWGYYDELVANASAQGIRVLPVLFGSPAWAQTPEVRYPISRRARAAFVQFVSEAVNRYKAGGAFWQSSYWNSFRAAHPGIQPVPITHWQLWNEVNSPSYSTPHPRVSQYARLVKQTGAAIHSNDPDGHLVLAGMFTRPVQRRAIPLPEYLNKLYKAKNKAAFDVIALHPYAHKAGDALKLVKSIRRLTRRNKDGSVPIWVTELGWASSGTPSRYTTSPEGQAARLQKSFSQLVANAGRFNIGAVLWYSFMDGSTASYWLNRTGLFEINGTPKPSWFAFVGFTGGQP
jgi:polysaccharide biosynthesis protein PslG